MGYWRPSIAQVHNLWGALPSVFVRGVFHVLSAVVVLVPPLGGRGFGGNGWGVVLLLLY